MLISLEKIFIPLLFIPQFLFSENNDSLKGLKKSPTTQYFYENQFEYADSIIHIDNSLNNFQNYLPRNHLGNSGLPYNNLFAPSQSSNSGFNYSKNNYENYFFSPSKIKFYNTRTPYTDLFYVIGSKKEQIFKMTFSYNVKKNWNVTADFHRIRSDGFYPRQNTNDNFLAVSSNYKSINNRYYFLASIIYNSVKNAENGGVIDSSVISNSGVNLSSAKRTNINKSVYFKQYFNFGPKSNDTSKSNSIIPESRLILTSMFENSVLKYDDSSPTPAYYSNIYNDSVSTADSVTINKIENELAWKRLDNKKHRGLIDIFGACFSIKHQFVSIRQNEINTSFNNIITGAEFYNTYTKSKFWWNVSGKYTLTGYNKNNYYTSALFKKAIKDSLNIFILKAETKLQSPDFIYNHYSSNNFYWNNNFLPSQESHLGLNFSALKHSFSLGANFSNYSNLLFFNNAAIATQYKPTVSVMGIYLNKNFKLFNWHLNNQMTYQYVPDLTVIRLPEYVLQHSLYYESDVFNSAMKLQVGASLFYTSAYYANAYMPATAQFYLQTDKKYGNYPFIDFFINAQIKTVRIFLKIDHLNSGLSGDNYALTPHYPMNTRAIKLGISWRFYD